MLPVAGAVILLAGHAGGIFAADVQLASTDSETELLQDIYDQVARARAERAQRKELRAAEKEQRSADKHEAIDALFEVERRLETGDSEVLDALTDATPALPLPAQRAVERASAAIDSEDLFAARYWVSVAISESERTELGR